MRIRITAETTEAEILAPITAARRALATAAAEAAVGDMTSDRHFIGERIVGLAQNVHSAEQVARAQTFYQGLCVGNPAERLNYLFDLVARRDDTWSGRGNDSTRSAHDAVTAWARDEVDNLRYAEKEARA